MLPVTRNKAFIHAYKRGLLARRCGLSETNNPYPDKKNWRGRVTFSRAFRRFWERGYQDSSPRGFQLFGKKSRRGRKR